MFSKTNYFLQSPRSKNYQSNQGHLWIRTEHLILTVLQSHGQKNQIKVKVKLRNFSLTL